MVIRACFFSNAPLMQDGKIVRIPYAKAEGVFYYLLVNKFASREKLCELFWGDSSDELAKRSLRNAFYVLRKLFGRDLIEPFSADRVQLGEACILESDLVLLSGDISTEIDDVRALCDFYHQDFLSSLVVRDSESFFDWIYYEQERYRDRYFQKLARTAEAAMRDGLVEAAKACYEKLIRMDSFQEEHYYKLIELLLKNNQRQEAIKVYTRLETVLQEELSIHPSDELRLMIEKAIDAPRVDRGEAFYCREKELAQMIGYYEQFKRNGKEGSFCIIGEPGVGKSALLNRFLDTAGNVCLKIRIKNEETEGRFPYELWHNVCSRINDLMESGVLTISNELTMAMQSVYPHRNMTGESGDAGITQFDFFILQLIRQLSQKRRIILAVDNLQWVDEKSLQLLIRVLTENRRVLFAGTIGNDRQENYISLCHALRGKHALSNIPLDRFSMSETKYIVSQIAPDLVERSELIYQDSEGNIFFIMEAVHNLKSGMDAAILAPKVYDSIGARLSRMDKATLSIANLVAVAQGGMSLELLQIVSSYSLTKLVYMLETLLNQCILREYIDAKGSVCYAYTHQKLRDHIYERISLSKRRLLHGKIADCMKTLYKEKDEAYIFMRQLIYHNTLAGNLFEVLTLRIERQERIIKRHYEMFRLDVVQPSWAISYLDDVIDDTKQELSEIAALLDNPQLECSRESRIKMRMRYAYVLGRYYYQNGRYEEGRDALDQMLCLARSLRQEKYLADAYLRMIFQSIDNMEVAETTHYIQTAEQAPYIIENPKLMALVRHYKAVVAYRGSRFDTAIELLEGNIRLMQDLPVEHDVNAQIALDYYMLSTIMLSCGELDKAEEYLRTSARFYRGGERDASSAMVSLNYGILAYRRGAYEKSMEKLRACEQVFIQSSFYENRGYLFAYLLIVSRILALEEEAARYAEICRELCRTVKNPKERGFVEETLKSDAS